MDKEKQKKIFKKIYITFTIVFVLGLTVIVFYPKYKAQREENQGTSFVGTGVKSPYHGFMLLTLKQADDKRAVPNVAVLNLDKSNIRFFKNEGSVNITPDGLGSKFVGVVSSLPANSVGTKDQDTFQLYMVDIKNNFARKQLTTSGTFFKRNPKLSPDGEEIAFMAREKDDEKKASRNIDDWNIYVTDLNGNEKLIGVGVYPQWSPDNKGILAMKSDGIYLYDLEKGASQRVIKADGERTLADNMTVSLDGSLLAWSMPDKSEISLMKISSWAPFEENEYKTIGDVKSFYPVFSPDMQDIAAIVVDKKDNRYGNLRVSIYNIEKSVWNESIDLSKYSASSISLTVWGALNDSINI